MSKELYDTSETKVVYLIGAGASAGALPLVKQTPHNPGISMAMVTCANRLRENSKIKPEYSEFIKKITSDFEWVAENSSKFTTPDTFAKFLYLKNEHSDLHRLKEALSFYFIIEQVVYQRIDDRVLNFMVTIMQTDVFPTNIKILNWNYDFQFQIAGKIFSEETFHQSHGGSFAHKAGHVRYYPSLGPKILQSQRDAELYTMVHLNGIAGLYHVENNKAVLNKFLSTIPEDINKLIELFITERFTKYSLLTFAWEKDFVSSGFLDQRMSIVDTISKDTDILVIIGYSFPFFNRYVDNQVFESILRTKRLKKIYFQDPFNNGEFLRKQFNLPDMVEVIHIREVENYFVPKEL